MYKFRIVLQLSTIILVLVFSLPFSSAETITRTIGDRGDTTIRRWSRYGGDWWDTWNAMLFAGFGREWAAEFSLRYTNVTIPQGATIESAAVKVKNSNASMPVDLHIQACDEDNSDQITGFGDFGKRPRTTANVRWQFTTGIDTEHTSPDIKTVIQEIVARDNWSSGNALQLIISDHTYKYPSYGGENHYLKAYPYHGSNYNSPLTITTYLDIGVKVNTPTGTIKIGAQTLSPTHKLRIKKGNTTYGIPLLDTDDVNASPVRIYDGSSIKALPKLR